MIERLSPHCSGRWGHVPRMVVIHGDAGKSDEGTLSWLQDERSRASYHYLVGRDGTTYRIVPEELKAWHAGISEWGDLTVVSHSGKPSVNPGSIGVAFANDGSGDEPFTEAQIHAGAELVADVCTRHSIPAHLIVGHYQVSPAELRQRFGQPTKTDPWDWFPWAQFLQLFALSATGRAA